MLSIIFGIIQEGIIYSIMALGIYISYKILDFPDLSVDGTFPLGMAVSFVGISNGLNPFLCLLLAFAAGVIAGVITGILHVKLKIKDLLSGILTMTALYSINYTIVGNPTGFLEMNSSTIYSVIPNSAGVVFRYRYLIISLIIAVAIKIIMDWYLKTKSGFLLRSIGDNPALVVTLGKNPGSVKILGLALANGLVALSGSLNLQYIKTFNVAAGTGTLVMGLAAVIIGTTLFGRAKHVKATTGVIVGMIVYKSCISLALLAGLESRYTNLIVTVLFIATLLLNRFFEKNRRAGVTEDA